METLRLLVREGTRRNVGPLTVIALVLTLGMGIAFASIEIADRTERAYPDYLRRAEVGDLVVNPSLDTEVAEQLMRTLPGVISVTSDSLLTVVVNGNQSDNFLTALVSSNGRYTTHDRPVVHEGRMIGSGREAFVSKETAKAYGLGVGDRIALSFYRPQYTLGDGEVTDVVMLGEDEAEVVGIGVFADEVLPDEFFARHRVLLTPDIAAKYDCVIGTPAADDPRPVKELFLDVVDPQCSTSYRYFSMQTEGGPDAAKALAGELTERFRAANEQLPPAFRENNLGYEVIGSFTADDADNMRRSLSPVVTSLRLFGFAAGLATIGVALLLATRLMRRRDRDSAVWHSLGVAASTRATALVSPVAVSALAGVVGALVVAWLLATIGPVASARRVVPKSGFSLSTAIVLPLVVAMVLLLSGLVLIAVRRSARPAIAADERTSTSKVFVVFDRWPSLSLGVRAATRGRGAGALLAGAVLAVSAVCATAVFSASVVHFVSTPALYGWSFDAGILVNAGYGPANLDAVSETLDRDEVEHWGVAALAGSLTVNGTSLPFVAPRPGFDELMSPSTVVTGRMPFGNNEIAIGSRTADDLDVGIGDRVVVASPNGELEAVVTGFVVLPAIGPYQSDRTSLGNGVLLSQRTFESLLEQARDQTARSGAESADQFAGFVAIDLAPGVDVEVFMESIAEQLPGWDPYGLPPPVYIDPVRPATVVDVSAMRGVPMLLAGAFAVTMTASVVAGVAAGTRARRRELAIVSALGATPAQVRSSVRWHALAVVVVGLIVGMPIGVVVGRLAFNGLANDLGVAPRAFVPLLLLVVIVAAVLAVGLLSSFVPARRAASRRDAIDALRTQRVEARLSY